MLLTATAARTGDPTSSVPLFPRPALGRPAAGRPAVGTAAVGRRDLMLAWRMPIFVVVTLVLGVLSHVSAARTAGAVPGLVISVGALVATWTLLARGEQSPVRMVLLVWVSQLEVHLSLAVPSDSALQHHDGAGGVRMLGGHALAGLLVALWLRRGEALAWRAASRLGGLLGVPRSPVGLVLPRACAQVEPGSQPARCPWWSTADPRRGPPLLLWSA